MQLAIRLALGVALTTLIAGCANDDNFDPSKGSDAGFAEAGVLCTDPNGDEDNDGIPNGTEGCLMGRDTDNDTIPDWQDYDSDGDGIPDKVEAGPQDSDGNCALTTAPDNGWPCDVDGDQFPDYRDMDSDGDGLDDSEEDPNGDGKLGCCLTACGEVETDSWQDTNCILTEDGCGPGQTCENGLCTPAIDFQCSQGETDPKLRDTFGDGKLDNERGTYICRDATEDRPGRKKVKEYKSTTETGDWNVALETTADFSDIVLPNADPRETAAIFDDDRPKAEVAGFVISLPTEEEDVQGQLTAILDTLNTRVPGGAGTVNVRSSGIEVKSHDRYDSVQGTILDVELQSATSISTVRNELVAAVLNRQTGELGNLPAPYGSSTKDFMIRFVTVRRFNFQRDEQDNIIPGEDGYPMDDGNKDKWRLIIMGAVAARDNVEDPSRLTGLIMDDLSNGTALATASDEIEGECDVASIDSLPIADIIWVVDESGSMDEDRENIVANAKTFFSRALASGLDFRMGVTNVCDPSGDYPDAVGKFCSQASTQDDDMGGVDRFLTPGEQSTFGACVNNPPGYEGYAEYGLTNAMEAVKRHLPRADDTQDKIRSNAKLVILVLTDEIPEELQSILDWDDLESATLDSAKQSAVNAAIKPYLDFFSGANDPEASAMFHLIGGVPNNSCDADVAHGYRELAQQLGGQIGDVCQQDLGNTMQVIIDSIVGAASPVKLEYVPISSSLAVAVDGEQVFRSRSQGFDYRSSSNSLAFIDVPIEKGSEVIASYYRWTKQTVIQ